MFSLIEFIELGPVRVWMTDHASLQKHATMSLAVAGEILLISRTTVPGLACRRTPSGPAKTLRTASVVRDARKNHSRLFRKLGDTCQLGCAGTLEGLGLSGLARVSVLYPALGSRRTIRLRRRVRRSVRLRTRVLSYGSRCGVRVETTCRQSSRGQQK